MVQLEQRELPVRKVQLDQSGHKALKEYRERQEQPEPRDRKGPPGLKVRPVQRVHKGQRASMERQS